MLKIKSFYLRRIRVINKEMNINDIRLGALLLHPPLLASVREASFVFERPVSKSSCAGSLEISSSTISSYDGSSILGSEDGSSEFNGVHVGISEGFDSGEGVNP